MHVFKCYWVTKMLKNRGQTGCHGHLGLNQPFVRDVLKNVLNSFYAKLKRQRKCFFPSFSILAIMNIQKCCSAFLCSTTLWQTGCSEINCTLRRYLSNRKRRQSLYAKTGIQIFLSYLWFEKKKRHRQVSGFGRVGIHRTSWCQLNQRRWQKYQLGGCLDGKQTIALWGVCMFWVNFQL